MAEAVTRMREGGVRRLLMVQAPDNRLRLWLVRQLLEGQVQTDQISQALSTRN